MENYIMQRILCVISLTELTVVEDLSVIIVTTTVSHKHLLPPLQQDLNVSTIFVQLMDSLLRAVAKILTASVSPGTDT
jgi:hypothetical protein